MKVKVAQLAAGCATWPWPPLALRMSRAQKKDPILSHIVITRHRGTSGIYNYGDLYSPNFARSRIIMVFTSTIQSRQVSSSILPFLPLFLRAPVVQGERRGGKELGIPTGMR